MDKTELVRRIAQEQGVAPELVVSLIDSTFHEIEKALLNKEAVDLPEFGRFFLRVNKSRQIMKRGQEITVPEKYKFSFRAALPMREALAQRFHTKDRYVK